MFGDRLLRRCFVASLLVNGLLLLWLSRADLYGTPHVTPLERMLRIQLYRKPPVPHAPPKPKTHPGPKLPPPPHPARIRQVVRRVSRPVPHPTPHPSPRKAPLPHIAPRKTPPAPKPPVATGSHSAQGTVIVPPSEGDVGTPTDATADGGGGDTGQMATNLSGDGTGLFGEYYRGIDFQTVAFTRADPDIDFNWPDSTPDAQQMPSRSAYSVRWTGQISPRYTETYTFSTLSDDGSRLWINGQAVIDDWQHHKATEREGTISLIAGRKYAIRLDYFENGTPPGKIRLWWASASQAKEIVPQSRLFPSNDNP